MTNVRTQRDTTTIAQGGRALIDVKGLAKAFGPTQALRSASFELLPGEIHALVGENGSGKSTLVKILSGVHTPDSGEMEILGVPLTSLRSPANAQSHGISTVFQEILTVNPRSVFDNVWLGSSGLLRANRRRAEARTTASEVLEELLGHVPPLDTPVERLSLSERQACVIARSLVRRPRVLILDEATSALDIATRDRLFEIVRRLTRDGAGVIVISHRMDELTIANRITVMRSGQTVKTDTQIDERELVRLMSGSETLVEEQAMASSRHGGGGDVVLRVAGLRFRPEGQSIDLEIRAGEVVGLAGLEGHGQDRFIRALWGLTSYEGAVLRCDPAGETPIRSPREAAASGIAFVARERRADAIFPWQTIRDNFALATLNQDRRWRFLSSGLLTRRFARYIERLNIVLGDTRDSITTLSGGNQQKVVVARWLATGPRVLLLNDPTRGIDISAKRDIYALLNDLAQEGVAVVMLSTELEEHLELMDRVLVFRENELFREIARDDLSQALLVSSFFGKELPLDG